MRVSSHRATLAFGSVAAVVLALALPPAAPAATVDITGGRTSVALDLEALGLAGLTLGEFSPEVQQPGDIANSVAFPINARDAAARPTSASYDPADFVNTFGGTIEHSGSVFFNETAVQVGDFSLAFSAARQGTLSGTASGFYIQSNAGTNAILFDIGAPSNLVATDESLTIDADLLVSPEFATLIQTITPDATDFTGVDVGNARVAATAGGDQPPPPPPVIPLPPALLPGLIGLGTLGGFKWLKRR